ncbi:MAG: helix-turn-helix transcriptional regulator [Candidatus Rokubacteria bacterium]|nr:helix-turn-helix transcriptional regulator [Candidatus Rokubacteria bacterium]
MSKNTRFGKRLKTARQAAHISLEHISAVTRIDLGRLNRLEQGQDDELDLSPDQIRALAQCLRLPPVRLVFGDTPDIHTSVVAQRSASGIMVQGSLFGADACPECGVPRTGSRCDRCGRFPGY